MEALAQAFQKAVKSTRRTLQSKGRRGPEGGGQPKKRGRYDGHDGGLLLGSERDEDISHAIEGGFA